ncbi:VOC family protein [Rhizobium halophytocola]|uniref:Catechol 2,3-dioxygenase-like lactoylglutathione lyase family enzyme n=1 Tax=Rhizobium halophytocola TaxID=735519 RepID=A0ABS4DWL7_9HYPH|nr:VOC family protein [Rhizobium halophytocola]MBP1850089.1 catechol 2,3-dioxygenase-like lactoylglutathione lyase family enzyme [Rhizobium halophytocola]
MSVLSHITLGTNDKDRSIRFYDSVLGVLGFARLPRPPEKAPAYEKNGELPTLFLYPPDDGRPATWGNGTHVAFLADTRDQVDQFHAQALRLGGMSEGQPGLCRHYGPNYYAAYVRDPDGNKLQAVCKAEG